MGFKDLTSQRFGKLVVLQKSPNLKGRVAWLCRCDCGKTITVLSHSLVQGNTKSCGCLHKEQLADRNYKHGGTHTRLYKTWVSMRQRCTIRKEAYKQWEGRGIKVCSEWEESFITFKSWAEKNGYKNNLTIDRIDVNGDYEPSNCRWITKREQQWNKTNTHYFEYKGQKKCLSELAILYNIKLSTLRNRIYGLKWSIDKAIETEIRGK